MLLLSVLKLNMDSSIDIVKYDPLLHQLRMPSCTTGTCHSLPFRMLFMWHMASRVFIYAGQCITSLSIRSSTSSFPYFYLAAPLLSLRAHAKHSLYTARFSQAEQTPTRYTDPFRRTPQCGWATTSVGPVIPVTTPGSNTESIIPGDGAEPAAE